MTLAVYDDDDDDPLDDPKIRFLDEIPQLPTKGYVAVPLAWLARVQPFARSGERLLVLQLLYRRCLMKRSRTVTLPNSELATFGISRRTKYRLLAELEETGAAVVEPGNGRSTVVTLNWFP
jgi:hypothetical protein